MTFWDFLDKHTVLAWSAGLALFVLLIIAALLIEGIVANRCRARIIEATCRDALANNKKVKVDL